MENGKTEVSVKGKKGSQLEKDKVDLNNRQTKEVSVVLPRR